MLRRKLTGLICSFSGPYLTAFSFDAQHLFYFPFFYNLTELFCFPQLVKVVNSLVLESGIYCRETVMRFLLRLFRISLLIFVESLPLLA